jgi:hypothetical protein
VKGAGGQRKAGPARSGERAATDRSEKKGDPNEVEFWDLLADMDGL